MKKRTTSMLDYLAFEDALKKEKLKMMTQEEMIDEIIHLQAKVMELQIKINAKNKRGKGRPKTLPKLQGGIFDMIGPLVLGSEKTPKKTGGRPSELTLPIMKTKVAIFERMKDVWLKDNKKTFINDMDFIGQSVKRASEAAKIYNKIKYYRQKTGMLQKQKTPAKNARLKA